MIFIVSLRYIEICSVIGYSDFDVVLTYCMSLCVLYLGFFNVFLVVGTFNYEGLLSLLLQDNLLISITPNSPYTPKVQANVVYV